MQATVPILGTTSSKCRSTACQPVVATATACPGGFISADSIDEQCEEEKKDRQHVQISSTIMNVVKTLSVEKIMKNCREVISFLV